MVQPSQSRGIETRPTNYKSETKSYPQNYATTYDRAHWGASSKPTIQNQSLKITQQIKITPLHRRTTQLVDCNTGRVF